MTTYSKIIAKYEYTYVHVVYSATLLQTILQFVKFYDQMSKPKGT